MTMVIWTIAFLGAIGFFCYQVYGRFAVLFKLKRDDGRDYSLKSLSARIKNTLIYAVGQKKFFTGDQPAGWMHIVIFWGFVTLGVQVVTMFTRGWFPDFHMPGFGPDGIGPLYSLAKDLLQAGVLVAVLTGLFRWTVTKPKRLFGILPAEKRLFERSHAEAILILCFIGGIMTSGFFYDAGRMVLYPDSPQILAERNWQPITLALSGLLQGSPNAALITDIAWWVHNLIILTFLNILPRSKHFHIITAVANVFLGKVEPKGRLAKRDFTIDNPNMGRSVVNQFTWKQAFDMYSCTECGRCAAVCPAAATGKPLAPRQFLLDLRDSLYGNQAKFLSGATEYDTFIGDDKAVIDEVVWSCVACRACEEACPVNIEYVDKIMDIRQHLVQEASRFPAELNRAFQGMERNSNPWGIAASERAAWAEGLNVPLLTEKPDAEYLYYVGCGGSFDANNKGATKAFVKLLQMANVSFAILGQSETCNGESARRLGNEYLFQTMADVLVQTINAAGVKKILVNCPHCFNTLKNEYPDFGGKWEVIHAAAFISELVAKGKIKLNGNFENKVVYHDSCYYGRFNDIYDEPRNLLNQIKGLGLNEAFSCKKEGTCCGAGGGRMWMEEKADQRVNVMRTEQCLEKGPSVVATSCPYCRIMIGSGVNEKGLSDKVSVLDVMEIVERGARPS